MQNILGTIFAALFVIQVCGFAVLNWWLVVAPLLAFLFLRLWRWVVLGFFVRKVGQALGELAKGLK